MIAQSAVIFLSSPDSVLFREPYNADSDITHIDFSRTYVLGEEVEPEKPSEAAVRLRSILDDIRKLSLNLPEIH